jgi:hypothetical protein
LKIKWALKGKFFSLSPFVLLSYRSFSFSSFEDHPLFTFSPLYHSLYKQWLLKDVAVVEVVLLVVEAVVCIHQA